MVRKFWSPETIKRANHDRLRRKKAKEQKQHLAAIKTEAERRRTMLASRRV